MIKGRSFPGKVLLCQQSEPLSPPDYSSHLDRDEDEPNEGSQEVFSISLISFSMYERIHCD